MSEKLHLMQDFGVKPSFSSEDRILPRAQVSSIQEAILLAKRIEGTFFIEEEGKPATVSGYQHLVFIEKLKREWKNDDLKEFD